MWATAKINKLSLLVERERFMFGKSGFDVFDLVLLIQIPADLQGLVSGLLNAFKWFTFLDDFFHLRFDRFKIIFGERMFEIEVVIEAGFQGWAKGQADSVEQSHHGAGHDVGTGVPQDGQCLGVLVGEDLQRDFTFSGKLVIEPNNVAVDFGCQCCLG